MTTITKTITSLNTKSFPVDTAFKKLKRISYRKDNLVAKPWPKLIFPEKAKIIKVKNELTKYIKLCFIIMRNSSSTIQG